jgi:hypothetical protein
VLGADDVAHALARLAAASPPGARQLTVQRIREADAALEFDMLYIGRGVRYPLDVLLRRAQQRGVLTVTESEEAFARGSVINFKLVEGRVRFDVSLAAAERSNLRLSSRLLAVAHQVQRENF